MADIDVLKLERVGRGGRRQGAGRKPGSKTRRFTAADDGGFLYLVQEVGHDHVSKIGIAKNPASRFSAHQSSNWRRLKMAAVFDCQTSRLAYAVEQHMLGLFRGRVVSGEWIEAPFSDIVREIESFAKENGLPVKMTTLADIIDQA